MKIGVIQASSQKEKNALLYRSVIHAAAKGGHTVCNFGVFPSDTITYSYVETALSVSLLLESGAVDFVVTGCSSGQGMMLACNSLPGVLCGYLPTPSDAYLFGRINSGNAASLPLGLGFGWAGELNLQDTLNRLFDGPFGAGYPPQEALRKQRDALLVKTLGQVSRLPLEEVLHRLSPEFVRRALNRPPVLRAVLQSESASKWQPILNQLLSDSPDATF